MYKEKIYFIGFNMTKEDKETTSHHKDYKGATHNLICMYGLHTFVLSAGDRQYHEGGN